MSRLWYWLTAALLGLGSTVLPVAHSQSIPNPGRASPRLEPVAETRLLMEGVADSNLRGLSKLLRNRPPDAEAWAFARGQALLIAETGNLLLMRPPRTAVSQEAWLTHAAELREAGANLARAAAAKDYSKARGNLATVANACNRCHQSFRVPVRVDPFADE